MSRVFAEAAEQSHGLRATMHANVTSAGVSHAVPSGGSGAAYGRSGDADVGLQRVDAPSPSLLYPPEVSSSTSGPFSVGFGDSCEFLPTVPVPHNQVRLLVPASRDLADLAYGIPRPDFIRDIWVTSDESVFGLENGPRNLCFVNAILQLLFRVRPFRKIVLMHDHPDGGVWSCCACALKGQFECMERTMRNGGDVCPVGPACLSVRHGTFGPVFKGRDHGFGGQHDATEFLDAVLEAIDVYEHALLVDLLGAFDPDLAFRAVGRIVVRSVMLDNIWGFVSRSRLRCTRCVHVSDSLVLESYIQLDVAGSNAYSLHDLLECRRSATPLSGVTCDRCGGSGMVQSWYIEKEPPLCMFRLKRAYRTNHGKVVKNHREISFPEQFAMRSGMYRLVGLLRHQGTHADCGQYISHVWLGDSSRRSSDSSSPPSVMRRG